MGNSRRGLITIRGEAPYTWGTMLVPEASLHLMSRLEARWASQGVAPDDIPGKEQIVETIGVVDIIKEDGTAKVVGGQVRELSEFA